MAGLAYSLSRSGSVWAWSVCDDAGVTLAAGAEPSQDRALEALEFTRRAAARSAAWPLRGRAQR